MQWCRITNLIYIAASAVADQLIMVLVILTALGIAGVLSAVLALVASEFRKRSTIQQEETPSVIFLVLNTLLMLPIKHAILALRLVHTLP
jgi:hypothetical protein